MSRIASAFANGGSGGGGVGNGGGGNGGASAFANGGNNKAFIAFVTGGDPSLKRSEEYILALIEGGADLIEIGIPFSDPIAEGADIQDANLRALAAGTTVDGIFELVRSLRLKTQVPFVLLTYLNPVYHYGYEAFFAACADVGVDGIIIADLPYEEKGELAFTAAAHGVDVISLIAPTSAERIATIAADATGYIYLVSSLGVTGMRSEINTDLASLTRLIRATTDVPVAVGFGVHTPEQAASIAQVADGVIVGSAIVRMIAEGVAKESAEGFDKDYPENSTKAHAALITTLRTYAHTMKKALR
ncbi:MAG: tryptophan synthase subunit alpha [Coriobacteriales bacterium]|jgi:tryptophan synthase alpha chain|nr:tryptophan synthase subunit alpha [Coriobacteriales bacterium]